MSSLLESIVVAIIGYPLIAFFCLQVRMNFWHHRDSLLMFYYFDICQVRGKMFGHGIFYTYLTPIILVIGYQLETWLHDGEIDGLIMGISFILSLLSLLGHLQIWLSFIKSDREIFEKHVSAFPSR